MCIELIWNHNDGKKRGRATQNFSLSAIFIGFLEHSKLFPNIWNIDFVPTARISMHSIYFCLWSNVFNVSFMSFLGLAGIYELGGDYYR